MESLVDCRVTMETSGVIGETQEKTVENETASFFLATWYGSTFLVQILP